MNYSSSQVTAFSTAASEFFNDVRMIHDTNVLMLIRGTALCMKSRLSGGRKSLVGISWLNDLEPGEADRLHTFLESEDYGPFAFHSRSCRYRWLDSDIVEVSVVRQNFGPFAVLIGESRLKRSVVAVARPVLTL